MIFTRRQADAIINMGDFLQSNYSAWIYSVVMRAVEDTGGPSLKTTTFTRATVNGKPEGQLSLLCKGTYLNPNESYASLDDFIAAYFFVV